MSKAYTDLSKTQELKKGDQIIVREHLVATIEKVRPFGTVDVVLGNGQRLRVSGLAF